MFQPDHIEPEFRYWGFVPRGFRRASPCRCGLDPEEALVLGYYEPVGCREVAEQSTNALGCYRLTGPERDPPRGQIPVHQVDRTGLGERGQYYAQVGILEVEEDPSLGNPHGRLAHLSAEGSGR
jgi:hypothetical protein